MSTRVHPSDDSRDNISIVTPKAGRMTTSSGVSRSSRFAGVAEEPDAERPQLVVDVRVVDDFAGQEDRAIGKAGAGLIGVVDRAIDAIAEPELPREVQRQRPDV